MAKRSKPPRKAKGAAKRVKKRQTLDAALKRAVRAYKGRSKPFAG